MKTLVKISLLLILSVPVFAADNEKAARAELDKMFELTNMTAMVDQMYAQIGNMWQQMAAQQNIPADKAGVTKKYFERLEAIMREDMSWEKMKEPMMQVYIRAFSLEEIKAMNEFYETPAGSAMLKKMPQVMQESMMVGQQLAQAMMPKIQALSQEMSAELQAK